MNTIFIIPTGINAAIGGQAGDANPVFKLVASVSDIAITHPNVVNASYINEMPENTWYIEGSMLDKFLEGKIKLKKPFNNKILLVVNDMLKPEIVNSVNAARHTIGCEIEIVELKKKLKLVGTMSDDGASGEVYGWEELVAQISEYDFDALAIASEITLPKETRLDYYKHGGINPYGGVEAKLSKLISAVINKPVAHAPVDPEDPEIRSFSQIVDPRIAPEMGSENYVHCVFKGLHKAPRISDEGLSLNDIDCLITPLNCYGPPHKACLKAGIPIIAVSENTTCLNVKPPKYIEAKNYLEAVGHIQRLKCGLLEKAIRA